MVSEPPSIDETRIRDLVALQRLPALEHLRLSESDSVSLVMTVGRSMGPIRLSLATLRPRRVLFLATAESRDVLERSGLLVPESAFTPSMQIVNKDDTLRLYQIVRTWYEEGGHAHVVADITGGTKPMSTALAMAAHRLRLPVVYWDGNQPLGGPPPGPGGPEVTGAERLVFVDDPEKVFGEGLVDVAQELAAHQEFHAAAKVLSEVTERVPGERTFVLRFWQALCQGYGDWDAGRFSGAAEALSQALAVLSVHGKVVLAVEHLETRYGARIRRQREALGVLQRLTQQGGSTGPPALELLRDPLFLAGLAGTFYHGGCRRLARGELESAVLLWYRLLEMTEQALLAEVGLDTAAPDYDRVKPVLAASKRTWERFAQDLGWASRVAPSQEIDLQYGFRILKALGRVKPPDLSRIRNIASARNYSLYAHGFRAVAPNQVEEFRRVVEDVALPLLKERDRMGSDDLDAMRFVDVALREPPPGSLGAGVQS